MNFSYGLNYSTFHHAFNCENETISSFILKLHVGMKYILKKYDSVTNNEKQIFEKNGHYIPF